MERFWLILSKPLFDYGDEEVALRCIVDALGQAKLSGQAKLMPAVLTVV